MAAAAAVAEPYLDAEVIPADLTPQVAVPRLKRLRRAAARPPSPAPSAVAGDELDDGIEPLFAPRAKDAAESEPMAWEETEEPEDEVIIGGGIMEELRREKEMGVASKGGKSAKRRLDLDVGDEDRVFNRDEAMANEKKMTKRKASESEPVREKKRLEKERRAQLGSLHAETQRLLRETRGASFKPTVAVQKPISSVLEKIRLRKLEMMKKSNAPCQEASSDADCSPENGIHHQPFDLSADRDGISNSKDLHAIQDVITDQENVQSKDLVSQHEGGVAKDDSNAATEEDVVNGLPCVDRENALLHDSENDVTEEILNLSKQSSSPPCCSGETSSEEEDEDKENMDPSGQKDLVDDSPPDYGLLRNFLDDEAEEEDDSDQDISRFEETEHDSESDADEVHNDLIATGYEEGSLDNEKRDELHRKWLEQQEAAEMNNFLQKLKFGQKHLQEEMAEDDEAADDDDFIDDSSNELANGISPANAMKQNTENARKMIAQMFADDPAEFVPSDDEEMEEVLVRQRIADQADKGSFISPLEDESSREVFALIKKLGIAPQPNRKAKPISSFDVLLTRNNRTGSSKSSFLGRTASISSSSSHRSSYKTFIFGRDDSNSRSSSSNVPSETNLDQQENKQPKKAATLSSSQARQAAARMDSADGSRVTGSGKSLFEILRQSSNNFDKRMEKGGAHAVAESQATHQFSAFKLPRRFSRVGSSS